MKIATVALGVLAICLGVLLFLADQEINRLRAEVAAVETVTLPQIAELEARIAELEGPRAGSPNGPNANAALGGVASTEAGASQNPMDGFTSMMSEPGMQTMIEQQTRMMINGMYADIFEDLALDEETETTVKEIVTKKATLAASIGFRMMDKSLDREGRKDVARELKDEMDALTESSRDLLSEEQFEELKLFEASQPDRQALQMFKTSLAGDAGELSYDQEEKLIAAMYEERSNYGYTHGDFADQMNIDPDGLDDFNSGSVETYIEETKDMHSRINERATKILDETQMEAFKTSQASYLEMQAMGMRMGAQMMESQGGGE